MQLDPRELHKARRHDRLAALIIRIGGFGVVVAMIGIFVEIIAVTIPLFKPAQVWPAGQVSLDASPAFLWSSEDGRAVALLYPDGKIETVHGSVGGTLGRVPGAALHGFGLTLPLAVRSAERLLGRDQLVVVKSDGFVELFGYKFAGPATQAVVELEHAATLTRFTDAELPDRVTVRRAHEGAHVVLSWQARMRSIRLWSEVRSEDWSGQTTTVNYEYLFGSGDMVDWAISSDAARIYILESSGLLSLYRWSDPAQPPHLENQVQTGVTGAGRLGFALGEISLLVASPDGTMHSWFTAPDAAGVRRLQRIHTFEPAEGVRLRIVPTAHDKTIYTLDVAGRLRADHVTTERRLFDVPGPPFTSFSLGARGDWLHTVDRQLRLQFWQVDNPHPEVSLKSLFGKIWYEGYDQPAYVWQSSSGSNDFEPKLSLIPLIFGTAKATFYALLFSVPLALMSAIYVSQLMGERARRYIKPAVEVMAAFPSVVIGFLAAIWVAPMLESGLMAFFAMLVVLPALLLVWLAIWYWIGRRPDMARRYHGAEIWVVIPVILAGVVLSVWLAPRIELLFFGGDLQQWIFEVVGARYDQRNSIVIAFALGFAVIPLIFTMTDDAMSNVPKSLTAASLALGATRWQTIWKVVLPSASPGIFAAIMIGFGRAVGETMIVLMAAGNTPILDWSFMNGMRTLSANIAVEVPEAPHNGTLFRVLFLSAVLLFVVTFIANSAAEIVRQRLRNRYGRF